MEYAANVQRSRIDEDVDQETQPNANELKKKCPKLKRQCVVQTVSSDEDTINRIDFLASNNEPLGMDTTATDDDKVILTGNRSPGSISLGTVSVPEDKNTKTHESLILTVSQGSHMSVPINKVKPVITKSGRLIRNTGMNNSVKYDIDSVYAKHPSSFSAYNNLFRSDSVPEGEQSQRSLRRDGQMRLKSCHERTSLDRTTSASSADQFVNEKRERSQMSHQASTDSCTSVSSNTQLVKNPYNAINYKINSIVWCPCFFFFCFACCFPAIRSMGHSDTFFNDGDYKKARIYARISTALYIIGTILAIAFFSTIFAVIIIFAG